jgi:hypothetical protein
MTIRYPCAYAAVWLIAIVSSPASAADPKKNETAAKKDQQAKEIAIRFMKAYKDKDMDAMMKMADVPWYDEPGKPVIMKERDEVKRHLQKHLDDFDKPEEVPTDVIEVFAYGPARKKKVDASDERFLKVQDQVFAEDDRIVLIGRAKNKEPVLVIGVRFRNGKPLVCGAFH